MEAMRNLVGDHDYYNEQSVSSLLPQTTAPSENEVSPSEMKKKQTIIDTFFPYCEQDQSKPNFYIKQEKCETNEQCPSVENETEFQCEDEGTANTVQHDHHQNYVLPTSKTHDSVTTPMNQYFVGVFQAIMSEECWNRAVSFLLMIPLQIPPVDIFRRLLHHILLESKDEMISLNASLYASQLLKIYPPWNSERRNYYHTVLLQSEMHSGQAMWRTVHDIIMCCFQKCSIESDFVIKNEPCANNCVSLLEYIVNVIERDYKESVSASAVSMSSRSMSETLISAMCWPSGNLNTTSLGLQHIMNFLDDIFANKITGLKMRLLDSVITLFVTAADCAFVHANCSEIEVLGDVTCMPLTQIQKKIPECKFITTSRGNFEYFLSKLPTVWLRIKICESVLNEMVYNAWDHICKPITLRKIVECFMYPEENTVDDEDCSPPKKKRKEEVVKKTLKGRSELHAACEKNLPGSLQELLLKEEAQYINAQDNQGRTPLHVACLGNSFLCANVLLRGRKNTDHFQKPDLSIQDNKGNTALHIAVSHNRADIVALLMDYVDEGMTSIRNNKDCTPSELARSSAVRALLKKMPSKEQEKVLENIVISDLKSLPEKRQPPSLCRSTGCCTYLFCLLSLLHNYMHFFQLQDLKAQVDEKLEIPVIETHLQKQFDYVTKSDDVFNACDDLLVLRYLSDIVEKFLNKISDSCPHDADVQEELLSMQFKTFL